MHEYLGIQWDFTQPGQESLSLSMEGYIKDIYAQCNVDKLHKAPASDYLYNVSVTS